MNEQVKKIREQLQKYEEWKSRRVNEGNYPTDINEPCEKTESVAKRLFGNDLHGVERRSTNSYYKEFNDVEFQGESINVKIRVSNHEPKPGDIKDKDSDVSKLVVVYVRTHKNGHTQKTLTKYLNGIKSAHNLSPELIPCVIDKLDVMIPKTKKTIHKRTGVKLESLWSDKFEIIGRKVFEYQIAPTVGFIQPDGSYLDSRDYGVRLHQEMATKILNAKPRAGSGHKNLSRLMQNGYMAFRQENKEAVVSTETYPTHPQLSTIKQAVDLIGDGMVEVVRNGIPIDYVRMSRDDLNRDMIKLKSMLNKANLPKPKL